MTGKFQQRKSKKLPILLATAGILAVTVGGICTYGLWLQNSDQILPGVTIDNVDVGGLSLDQVKIAVKPSVPQDITIHLPDRQFILSGDDMVGTLNRDQLANDAWNLGRDGTIFATMSNFFSAKTYDTMDIISYQIWDSAYIAQSLETLATLVADSGAESQYTLSSDEEFLTIQMGQAQQILDVEALQTAVENALNMGETDVQMDYTSVSPEPIDVAKIFEAVQKDPVEPTYDPDTKTVLEPILGLSFDVDTVQTQINQAEDGAIVTIPLEKIPPAFSVEGVEEQLFGTILGAYSDNYVWNPARTTNIELSAQAIDGTILNPGEEFSFNGLVGERTSEKGYQAASVYVDGNTIPELGGGVCQVASTIYTATLYADLTVTERLEHMFLVTYVPMGMDAAIYWDAQLDYKFVNSTENPIRVDTWLDNGELFVEIRGTKTDNRFVEMTYEVLSTTPWTEVVTEDATKDSDYRSVTVTPYTGYTVQTYRQYVDENGNPLGEHEKVAFNTYRSRDQQVTVGKPEELLPEEVLPEEVLPEEVVPEDVTPEEPTLET